MLKQVEYESTLEMMFAKIIEPFMYTDSVGNKEEKEDESSDL